MAKTCRYPAGVLLVLFATLAQAADPVPVKLIRVPDGGIQPQVARDSEGTVHLIYYRGSAGHGDVFYVRCDDDGATFSRPIRVNSQPGSAVAAGTIRGAQLALGKEGRVHVAWNGSSQALPKGPLNPAMAKDSPYNGLPMLYTRLNEAGTAFEPQRNLMQQTFALDGGGSVAADGRGNVYVAWHAASPLAPKGEEGRRVWIARSKDEGKTFRREEPVNQSETGACGCCAMRVFADSRGGTYMLYRSATGGVNRDMYLLTSTRGASQFRGTPLQRWQVNACPMSSMAFAEAPHGVLAAWETTGQVYYGMIDRRSSNISAPIPAPGKTRGRKHPALACISDGRTIMVWAEGTGWQKGGSLAWQIFDKTGKPTKQTGRSGDIPVWSFATVFATADGGFAVIH